MGVCWWVVHWATFPSTTPAYVGLASALQFLHLTQDCSRSPPVLQRLHFSLD